MEYIREGEICESIGLAYRQAPQDQRVDQRESGETCTQRQCEGSNRRTGDNGVLAEHAKGELNIFEHRFHPRQQLDVPARFADAQPISELSGGSRFSGLTCHPCGYEVCLFVRRCGTVFPHPERDGRQEDRSTFASRDSQDMSCSCFNLGVLENVVYRICRGTPPRFLDTELTASFSRDFVRARAPVVFGRNLACSYPTRLLHAVERRIQRALLDAQIIGEALDVRGDAIAVEWTAARKNGEDEQWQ